MKNVRKMGKMKAEFALVGCVVIDEDREYYNKEWRDLYIDLKVNAKKYGTMDNFKRPTPNAKCQIQKN